MSGAEITFLVGMMATLLLLLAAIIVVVDGWKMMFSVFGVMALALGAVALVGSFWYWIAFGVAA